MLSLSTFDAQLAAYLHSQVKNPPEMFDDALHHRFHFNCSSQQLAEGGHALIAQAAGHNPVKVAEVGIHIESKAVRGDPAGDVHAHGDQFVVSHPDTRRALEASGLYAKISRHAYKDLLERAHIPGDVPPVLGQVQD